MGMKIYINCDLAGFDLLCYCHLDSPNRWLVYRTRIQVVSVKILCHRVQPIVAAIHTIGVQHGHDFEHELVSQLLRLNALLIREKFPDSGENERGRGFTRVNAGR